MGEVEHGISNFPLRVYLTADELISSDRDTLLQNWSKQELYIDWIESQLTSAQSVAQTQLRECEEKLRQMQTELARRDSILVMRLNAKEQEMQDLIVQIQELKASQAASAVSLRSSLLDPAVNLLIQRLRKELDKAKSALEETQNELSAWKFTPDSNTGKRLMAKCRLLYQENEELGRMISSGRLAKLEGDLALQRKFGEEMKKSQSELDEFLQELDEDVEGMQSTIYYLQQQLRQTRDQLAALQKENELLRNISSSSSSGISTVAGNSGLHPLKREDNVDGLDRYMQANGTSDHSINQSYGSPINRQYDLSESHAKQHQERVTSQGCTVHNIVRRESEPDSNNYESGQNAEETSDIPLESEGAEERIGEADTTGNNDAVEERADVVVCQAIPDEGFDQRFSEPTQKQRTTNGSGEGSPDDGGGTSNEQISDQPGPGNSLNDNSNDTIYNRADSGAGCSKSGHRNSTEVGDLVSGSGMEDESDFRTSGSSMNGELRSGSSILAGPLSEVSTSDETLRDSESEAVVEGVGSRNETRSSAKCRKRTTSQMEVDESTFRTSVICRSNQSVSGSPENPETGVSSRSGKGSSLRKRFRSDPESDALTNGEADEGGNEDDLDDDDLEDDRT